MAEPLAAPFARAGSGYWDAGISNAVLSGTASLSVQFSASNGNSPLQQIDLFVDGRYFSTLTNLVPRSGNLLSVALNGYPITYTVPTNATLSTVATGLVAAINVVTNATRLKALARGDRIELQSIATNHLTTTNLLTVPFYVADTTSANSTGQSYRVTYLPIFPATDDTDRS